MSNTNYTQVGPLLLEKPTTTTEVAITPQVAKVLLQSHNKVNRDISKAKIAAYVRDIKNGEFESTCAAIHINTNGQLENGQHTLSAIAESGKTLVCPVKTGVRPGYGKYVDIGKQRNLEDAVTMEIRNQGRNPTYVKQLTQDTDRLITGLYPKDTAKKASINEKVKFALKNEGNFLPINKLFYKNKNRMVGKTSVPVNKPVFRAPFQYFMTGYAGISKQNVLQLAEDWLEGKFSGNHPLNKFNLWYSDYVKSVSLVKGNVDTFIVYSMLLSAVTTCLMQQKTGIRTLKGITEEGQFSTTLKSRNAPSYP